jgi:hypothetical protein
MSAYSRTYKIELPADAAVTPWKIRKLAQQQLKSGARGWDFIELKTGSKIVTYRKIDDILGTPSPVESVTEPAEC